MSEGPMFSPDGNHFWDGQAWQAAVSPDGRWRWDGTQWRPAGAADWSSAPGAAAAALRAQSPARASWQVAIPQARSLVRPVADAAASLSAVPAGGRRTNRIVGYRKEATGWTNPLVLFSTFYFLAGGAYGIVLTAALAPEYRDRFSFGIRATGQVTSRQADELAATATGILIAVLVFFSAIAVLLGLLTFKRMTVVFYLQLIGSFFSILSVVSAVSTAADQRAQIAPNIFWSSLIFDMLGAALFFWLLFARRAYGPWGLRRVPVYADPPR